MSPRASCLGDEHGGHRGALLERAVELPGDAEHGTPSSFACASSSAGAAQALSASSAAGRSRSIAKSPIASRIICCSSVGVRSKSSARAPVRLARGLVELLLRGERPPGGAGGAEAVLGGRVEEPLGALAHADAVEQLEPGDAVEGPEAEAHASVGGVHRRFQVEERPDAVAIPTAP